MRFLCISPGLPGQLDPIASSLAENPANCVYMASLHRRADVILPGVSSVLIRKASLPAQNAPSDYCRMWLRALKMRENAMAAYKILAGTGFSPDVVLFQAGAGIALNIRELFGNAIFVAYSDPSPQTPDGDLQNLQFLDADYRFTRFAGEDAALRPPLRNCSRFLPIFVDTEIFRPGNAKGAQTLIFADYLAEPDLRNIWRLALGLIVRGHRINFVTRTRREILSAWQKRLDKALGTALQIHSCPSETALAALGGQCSAALFPNPARKNFQDVLAMMSCALPVIALPAFPFLRPDVNMLAWPAGTLEEQLHGIVDILGRPLNAICRQARASVLADHSRHNILPRHLDFLHSLGGDRQSA